MHPDHTLELPLDPRGETDLGRSPLGGRLTRAIGKPRRDWTADDLVELVHREGIRLVSLMHVGGDGCIKTLDFAPRSEEHLREIILGGQRADGSSVFAGMGIRSEQSDILLRPRVGTAFIDPFATIPTLAVLCRHDGRDGAPLPESPDTIARAAFERIHRELGIEFHALGEVEYFLGKRPAEDDIYGADDRGYHATSPFVFGEALRREALGILAEMGIGVKYAHSEVGYIGASEGDGRIWEQHEIELALAPLPHAADAVVVTQWVLRNLARRHGMLCSFEPILREGHAGSGLHFHVSPVRDGQHLGGRAPSGELHPEARWLIGGLVQLGDGLMAFGNRKVGSFVRLRQGKEAPNTVVWGEFDRKALIRLPVLVTGPRGEVVSPPTVEFRLPDGSAHPHLLLAGIAQAMMMGRETESLDALLEATSTARGAGAQADARAIPTGFGEIARAVASNRQTLEAGGVFPSHVLDRIVENLLG